MILSLTWHRRIFARATWGMAISALPGKALIIGAAAILVSSGATKADDRALIQACTESAQGFIHSLDEEQKALAVWAFSGDKRRKWTYYPNVPQLDVREEGLLISAMSEHQRIAAHRLIECGLSSQGYQKAAGIMRLDDILGQTDLYRPRNPDDAAPVGSGNYWLAIFGNPGNTDPWGWQLEGHHLGLNFTVVDGSIAFAPAFMGADPAEVPDGPYAGWRLLGGEVDKALALVNSLSDEQHERAILSGEIPERLITGPGRPNSLATYSGIRAAEFTELQLRLLWELIDEYIANSGEPIAADHREKVLNDGPESIWFSWMGPTEPNSGIYYRVHTPSLLIEFVTARNRQSEQREPNPNHVHSMFRYPGNDFGEDLLRHHYETSPEHQDE